MPLKELILRLALAAALGMAIGIEREFRRKPAGLRTNMLIGLGSALFTIVSLELARVYGGGSPDRIAAQIVTGIGFLGGGAIMRSGNEVHGLTTAATAWVNAAIGMAAGTGNYAAAMIGTLLTLLILVVLPPIENYFDKLAGIERRRPQQGQSPPLPPTR
ncbi:MAG TPA: MgtC/SapB family protein [Vicinamibacterales bacterium]|jgi:putative Mg2+ transporter-C (MgtC) family protein|nr:MgtC/SapB family protein [Vicinamibacterales bacterium]